MRPAQPVKLMDQQSMIKCLQINSLCECSKPTGPDLGIVYCDQNLQLASLNNHFFYTPRNSSQPDKPPIYSQQLSIYKITFLQNGIRQLHNLTFQRTGVYNLEIIQQRLVFLSNKAFFGLERTLRTLSLESNHLISVPSAALAGLRKLTYLNLNHNRIRQLIADQLFPASIQATLKTLLIAHNHLAHIDAFTFQSLSSLQHLDLSGNHLIFLNDCAFCSSSMISNSKLLYLNLASNRLSLIPFALLASLGSLQALDLADNLIETVQDLLYFDNGDLTMMKRAGFKDAYRDSVREGAFKEDADYSKIDANYKLNRELGQRTICLEYLNLEHNLLTRLTNQSFAKFSCLRTLSLASNEIGTIDDNAFKNVEIHQLNLRSCMLSRLTSSVFSGKEQQLTHLDLSENMLDYQQNDTFIGLEKLTSFKFNENTGKFRLNPLSLAQSQYSLMEFEFTQATAQQPATGERSATHSTAEQTAGRNEPFNPINYEIEFKNLRRLSLTFFGQASASGLANRLEKKQLLAYGDYNLHYLDLSRSWLEDLNDKDLFASTPYLLHLNLSANSIRRIHPNLFRPLSNSLISLDLHSALHPQAAYSLDCELFRPLSSLRSLNLIENNIYQFKVTGQQHCFDQLGELRLLQLDFNYLSKLKPNQFERLKSLVHLQLSNNQLNQLDSNTFNELPLLAFVDLSFNSIRIIKQSAFSDLISLKHIDLANNQLQSLEPDAFVNLPLLEYINFNKNQLKQFNWNSFFDQIGALSTGTLRFDLQSNRLVTLNFLSNGTAGYSAGYSGAYSASYSSGYSGGSANNYLNSSRTPATNSQLASNQLTMNFIEIIDLTNNQLTEIESNNFQFVRNSLLRLHLDHNRLRRLSKLALANLVNLQFLSLRSNFLTALPDDLLIDDYSLQEINLSGNLLINLPARLFAHNAKLTRIDLRHNLIKKLPNALFANCSHLEQLYLDHNSLREFPLNAFGPAANRHASIRLISLAYNHIEHLNPLAGDIYRNLIYLNLSHNSIKQFHSHSFVNLIELDLSANKLQFDEIENLLANFHSTRMTGVDLSGIGLRQMPVLNLPNLITLNLADNLLTYIYSHSFRHIEHLHALNLSNNRLNNVPNNLFNQKLGETLIELDLSNNPIYTLNNDSFVGLRKLQRLALHGLHRLHYIQLGVFQSLRLLQDLSVSYYEHQISSLCALFASANLHIRGLVIHFDHLSPAFSRKFLYDAALCRNGFGSAEGEWPDGQPADGAQTGPPAFTGLGRKLERIHFVGASIKRLDKDVFSEFSNERLTLQFTNTSVRQLALDLSNSKIRTLDLHLDRSFQSGLEITGSKVEENNVF